MYEISGLFLLGILNGAFLCTLSCLQYIGPFLLSAGEGFKDGVKLSLNYLFGKMLVYSSLAAFVASLNFDLSASLNEIGKYTMGTFLIIMALLFPFLISKKKFCGKRYHSKKKLTMFIMGVTTSFAPCPAVVSLLLVSANSGSTIIGFFYGLSYAAGLMISPMLPAGGGLALISKNLSVEVKNFMPYLKGLSMIIIFILGIRMLYQ